MHNQANQTHFILRFDNHPEIDLPILYFDSTKFSLDNDKIFSQNYSFQITCYNKNSILLSKLINQKVMLIVCTNEHKIYHHGIITSCTDHQIPHIADEIIIHSPLHPLTLNTRRMIYHNVSLPDLIDQILMNNRWEKYEYQLLLENHYPLREYVVQYQENDFEFLHRKCAYYGVFYTFDQTAESSILIFCDNINNLNRKIGEINLSYQPESGQLCDSTRVFHMEWCQQMVTDNIRLNDYNYRTPDISLLLESIPTHTTLTPLMTDYRFQDHYKTIAEGQFLLKVRQQALDCRRKIWFAKTDCKQLQPGNLIHINNHPLFDMNGQFVVIAITHYGDQSAAFHIFVESIPKNNYNYYNIIELIPAQLSFRPIAPEPVYQENCLANITGILGDYADIDEQGRYLIKPKFDTSNTPDYQTSHRVRLIQPLSGYQYGVHFPLHLGTEILITHVNGDPDRPIIMGVLPNINSLPPVTANNYTQNIIKSWGGNQLLFDDQQNHEYILLNTQQQQNYLLLDATYNQHQINLYSLQGNLNLLAGTTITSSTQNNHQQIIGNNYTINVQNESQIITKNGDIQMDAKVGVQFSAKNDLKFETSLENIILQSGNDTHLNANDDINLIVDKSDLTIQTKNGDLVFNAAQNIVLQCPGLEQIYLAQGGSSIQITPQSITLNSPTAIQFSAELINMNGNVCYGDKKANEISTNLILHYQDELGSMLNNLEGIYHLLLLPPAGEGAAGG